MKYVLPFLVLMLAGCLKVTTYPNTPDLKFVNMVEYPDSAVLTFSFTDGDGDFGVDASEAEDNNSIFSQCPNAFNLRLTYFEKQNGNWVAIPRDPCAGDVAFYYTVPWVRPTGQNKTQKGDIKVTIAPAYYLISDFDTCKFEAVIFDRAFNTRPIVTTRTFVKP